MSAAPRPDAPEEERRRRALDDLQHLEGEPTFAGSALAAAGRRAARHFAGADPGETPGRIDPVELWGRRIGRGLSLAGCVGLGLYLYLTYLR